MRVIKTYSNREEEKITIAAGRITNSLRATSIDFFAEQAVGIPRRRMDYRVRVITRGDENFEILYFLAFVIMSAVGVILWKG